MLHCGLANVTPQELVKALPYHPYPTRAGEGSSVPPLPPLLQLIYVFALCLQLLNVTVSDIALHSIPRRHCVWNNHNTMCSVVSAQTTGETPE